MGSWPTGRRVNSGGVSIGFSRACHVHMPFDPINQYGTVFSLHQISTARILRSTDNLSRKGKRGDQQRKSNSRRSEINPAWETTLPGTMLIRFTRQGTSHALAFLKAHRLLLLYIFFVAPTISYLVSWYLSTTETFFPRPLRQAKEVLVVVAHPDDECPSSFM